MSLEADATHWQNVAARAAAREQIASGQKIDRQWQPQTNNDSQSSDPYDFTFKVLTVMFSGLTLVVIAFQSVISRHQLILMRRQTHISIRQARTYHRQAEIMARQADIADRQTKITERATTIVFEPTLLVELPAFTNHMREPNWSGMPAEASYRVRNIGKTPATLRAKYNRFVFVDKLPRVPEDLPPWDYHHEVIEPDTPDRSLLDEFEQYSGEADEETLRAMRGLSHERRGWRWFLVSVWVYDDAFGHQHEYAFCFHFGRGGGGPGMPYGGAAYNYRKIRGQEERI